MKAEWQSVQTAPTRQSSSASLCCPADSFAVWDSSGLSDLTLSSLFLDQSKHILNVHLLQLSSCSTAYAFRITRGHDPKGF